MSRKSLQKVPLVKKEYRPGIEASRRVRVGRSIAHLETMRDDYVAIVRDRLTDPAIKPNKKLSFYAIADCLTHVGHRAPRGGAITYKIAQRLYEFVGVIIPSPKENTIIKQPSELEIGDCVEVVARHRASSGSAGIVRRILKGGAGFQVEVDLITKRKLLNFLPEEIRHQPDERHFYDPLSSAEG